MRRPAPPQGGSGRNARPSPQATGGAPPNARSLRHIPYQEKEATKMQLYSLGFLFLLLPVGGLMYSLPKKQQNTP